MEDQADKHQLGLHLVGRHIRRSVKNTVGHRQHPQGVVGEGGVGADEDVVLALGLRGHRVDAGGRIVTDLDAGGGREDLADAARRHLAEVPYTEHRAGDVPLFRWRPHLPAKHAGIAMPDGRMMHAQEGAAVTEIALNRWWLRHLCFAFRFFGVDA